jgi:hypothetical protein
MPTPGLPGELVVAATMMAAKLGQTRTPVRSARRIVDDDRRIFITLIVALWRPL